MKNCCRQERPTRPRRRTFVPGIPPNIAVPKSTSAMAEEGWRATAAQFRRTRKPRPRRVAGKNPMSLIWPSPATGDVTAKNIINGQKVKAGDELYRIADHSHVWVITMSPKVICLQSRLELALRPQCGPIWLSRSKAKSRDLSRAEGRNAYRARPHRSAEPRRPPQSRHVRRRGVPTGVAQTPVIAVPTSALIDSGNRQVVLIAKGEGQFEPRPVKLGQRGDGYTEILKE